MDLYLFICCLFDDAVSSSGYIASNHVMDNELERYGRKQAWPDLKYCPDAWRD
jgi:hypothetical protein